MSEIKEKVLNAVKSEMGKNVLTLLAYAINKTETEKDNEIVENAAEVSEVVADALATISSSNPTLDEVKAAALNIIESIAKETSNKWDDRAVGVLKMFM